MTAYIINVFATSSQTIGKGKRQRIKVTGYGYQGWNTNAYLVYREHGRLEGSGSFVYPGFIRARQAAMTYLALPATHQVAVKTNQSRDVYRWFKSADGRITGYASEA